MANFKQTMLAAVASGVMALPATGADSNDTLQLNAKAAIENNAKLRDLNLWLSARDGVVVVTGSVPTADTTAEIEKALAKVPGVSIVRVNTWVTPVADPLRKVYANVIEGPKASTAPTIQPALAMNPVLPGQVTVPVPPVPWGVGMEPDARLGGTVVVQKYEPAPMGGFLQAPVETSTGSIRLPEGVVVPPAPTAPLPYPTIASPRVPVAPVERELSPVELALELVKLRQLNPAFEGLNVDIRDGIATVRGSASASARAEFAEELKKLPGVKRVVND